MTAILVEWLLRPETLAWTSLAFLVVGALRPIAQHLEPEVPEGEIHFTYVAGPLNGTSKPFGHGP
jgi:hypothetical protein